MISFNVLCNTPIYKETITNEAMHEILILKKFDFTSKLQRMSVVVSVEGSVRVYAKGSPEKLRELCIPRTVPDTFHQVLEFYAQNGFRVLCCATKLCEHEPTQREEVESDLTFLGFLLMENRVKPATIAVIEHLQQANIRSLMITGDNILTAVSVARSCKMITAE
jgi:cation-transporting ATPase 13A3/4/5